MKKYFKMMIIALIITCITGTSLADTAGIMVDQVFTMVYVTLNANKQGTFQLGTNGAQSEIYISSVSLYRQLTSGSWTYVSSLPAPSRVQYNTASFKDRVDYSSYISSGTYRIRYTAVAGNSTITRNSDSRTYP